jgi:glycerol-3-phosphate dehydrogenase
MAEEATDALVEALGLPKRKCTTRSQPYFTEATPANSPAADPDLWIALRSHYGPRAAEVYDTCLSAPELSQPLIESYGLRLGEVVYSAEKEKVERLEDLVLRRTRLAWRPELTDQLRDRITALIRRHLPSAALK